MAAASETDTNRTMEASYGELPFSHMDKETVFNNLIEELKNIATTYALNPKILTDAIADKAKFKFLSSEQKQANPENDPDQSFLGNLLLNQLNDLLGQFESPFADIVINNLSFSEIRSCITTIRTECQLVIKKQQEIQKAGKQFMAPDRTLFEMEVEERIKERIFQHEDEVKYENDKVDAEEAIARESGEYIAKEWTTKRTELRRKHANAQNELHEINKRYTNSRRLEFYNEYNMWKMQHQKSEASSMLLNEAETDFKITSSMEMILMAFESASSTIANHIKDAVEKPQFSAIKAKLSGPINIISCSELSTIDSPFQRGHLSSIHRALVINYHKMSFVKFTNKLFETLKFAPKDSDNLIGILSQMDSLKTEWSRKKLWDHLTPDGLFTALLLRSLPTNRNGWNVQQQIITEVTAFVKKVEKGDEDSSPFSDHPIYDYAKKQIEDFAENTTFNQQKKSNPINFNKSPGRTPYVAKAGYINPKSESAADAEESEQANIVSTGQVPKLFSGEVTDRKTLITLPATGNKKEKTVPYFAVHKLSTLCPKCFKSDNTRDTTSTCEYATKHYATQCTTCKMYGHHTSNCLQKK